MLRVSENLSKYQSQFDFFVSFGFFFLPLPFEYEEVNFCG